MRHMGPLKNWAASGGNVTFHIPPTNSQTSPQSRETDLDHHDTATHRCQNKGTLRWQALANPSEALTACGSIKGKAQKGADSAAFRVKQQPG